MDVATFLKEFAELVSANDGKVPEHLIESINKKSPKPRKPKASGLGKREAELIIQKTFNRAMYGIEN